MKLAGWGNWPVADVRLGQLRYADEAPARLAEAPSLIARGNGRAYGDAALNPELTLSMRGLSRVRVFDRSEGRITVEAGALLSDLLPVLIRAGWFVPVTPGTKFVTIGGMAAADVHGKNHHGAGSFAHYVDALELLTADGQTLICTPWDNAELFAATLGGMGLTGVILSVTFRLQPIETTWMRQETLACSDLDSVMAAFEESGDWTYSVAWIDCLASGGDLGRSLLYRAEHARPDELAHARRSDPLALPRRHELAVPFYLPGMALNGMTVRAFNAWYYRRNAARAGTSLVDLDSYFYPLDAIGEWNRIYGRGGFAQHQSVLPLDQARNALGAMLERIAGAGSGSFLTVLKRLGPGRSGLSFPLEGYTLALDFPVNARNHALLDELDTIVEAHGGRIYLAKDARAGRSVIEAGYPEIESFRALRAQSGARARMESLMSRRLGL
ncbi:MAG: FAD-binding oxidoreductase [Halofilum sp. (in: g-proteobacteria)]